jgi:predicted nucleic acid-binding protein
MPRYFLDSSALAKAYHVETGTEKMVALLAEPNSEIFISSLSVVEIQSVFSQKVREGKIAPLDYAILKQRFGADIQSRKLIVKNLLRPHQKAAEKLLETHANIRRLRTLDALQLGAMMELRKKIGIDHFVCADKHLVEVARLEGISVLNQMTRDPRSGADTALNCSGIECGRQTQSLDNESTTTQGSGTRRLAIPRRGRLRGQVRRRTHERLFLLRSGTSGDAGAGGEAEASVLEFPSGLSLRVEGKL